LSEAEKPLTELANDLADHSAPRSTELVASGDYSIAEAETATGASDLGRLATQAASSVLELVEELQGDTSHDFDYEIDGDALLQVRAIEPSEEKAPSLAEETELDIQLQLLNQRLEFLEEENGQLRWHLRRWQSEFENARRRQERDREELRLQLRGESMKELLPLVDNFERALNHSMNGPVTEEFVTGITLIYRQLVDLLARHGVTAIAASGEVFDPNLHEAVMIECRPGYEANTVIEEVEKGYTIGSRLLRPARVKVAIPP
jgi:molecular chaperone GrpE